MLDPLPSPKAGGHGRCATRVAVGATGIRPKMCVDWSFGVRDDTGRVEVNWMLKAVRFFFGLGPLRGHFADGQQAAIRARCVILCTYGAFVP